MDETKTYTVTILCKSVLNSEIATLYIAFINSILIVMAQVQDINTLAAQVQALLKEVCRQDCRENGLFCEYVDKAVDISERMHDAHSSDLKHNKSDSMLENAAVNLWNFAVGLKTKGTLSCLSNAKLRYISMLLVDSCIGDDAEETTLKKKIMMGIKTARAWLDAGNQQIADKILLMTDEYVKNCQRLVVHKINTNGPSEMLQKQKIDVEQDIFKLLCYRAESCIAQNKHREALDRALLAKEMLINFPKEGAFLAMMCYNFGVDTYQKRMYEETVTWLRESFELGKGRNSIGSKNQARTLRLLAFAYIDWNPQEHIQKALNAVTLANTEHPHSAGLYLKLKILLLNGDPDEMVGQAAEEIIKQSDITVDIVLSLVQLLTEYKRYSLSKEILHQMMSRFENNPDLGKLKTTQLELLLQSQQTDVAKEFVEQCITDHNTGRPIEVSVLKRFHVILWEQAATEFEGKNYQPALDWYNYSLSLYTSSQPGDKNLAKLHRNRANCYLNLQLNEKATDALKEAEKHDPESIHTQFTMYKLALADTDVEKARLALHKMCDLASQDCVEETDSHGLICLAAHMAFQQHSQATASEALECLVNTSPDHLQVLTALRCLIRIKLSETKDNESVDLRCITNQIRTGYNKLLQLMNGRKDITEQLYNEVNWFMKISWNMALQSEDQPDCMRDLFTLCCQLSSLCSQDNSQVTRQKTCRLIAAAASLQVARTSIDQQEQRNSLEDALLHVEECKQLCTQLQLQSLTESKTKDTTEKLLLIYEFEARVKLNDQGVEHILEKALKLPDPDPKIFETLAALAVEKPAQNKSVSVRALKVAIRKHLQIPQPDYTRCSKLFHSLIHLALAGGVELGGKEEAWNYYVEVIEIIDKQAQDQYPEIEVIWLMTKAWNCGIHFFSANRFEDAEKWCSTSMKLLQYLGTMKSNYEDHMNNTYAEILSKIEKSNSKGKLKGQEE